MKQSLMLWSRRPAHYEQAGHHLSPRWLRVGRRCSLLLLLVLFCGVLLISPAQIHHAHAQSSATISVDPNTTYQTIDGFGTALVGVGVLYGMNSTPQQQILDLLFSQSGAGLNMARFELGNGDFYGSPGFTIEPNNPGSPTATPNYVWDHSADHTVWALQQAQQRGVNQFYGDAWSAPGFMKTNNDPGNQGDLCGEASCSSGDWRQAYANYLVQYLQDYQSEGIHVNNVDFVNEVEAQVNYESMTLTASQLADFIKILGPTIEGANLHTRVVCCDDSSQDSTATNNMNTILSDPTAASYLGVATVHAYGGSPSAYPNAQQLGIPTWESEHACGWTAGTTTYLAGPCSGQNKSDEIYNDLTNGISAYFDWTGVGGYNLDLIQITDPNTYQVSSQFWATANYSRYIRPGAVRIGANSSDGNMYVTSFKNIDGSYVLVVDNHEGSDTGTTITIPSVGSGTATPYVTNNAGGMQQQSDVSISNGSFTTTIPANATTTFRIQPASTTAPAILNSSFENPVVVHDFQYNPSGAFWSFNGNSGVTGERSGFTIGNSNTHAGTQVAFLQGNSNFSQSVSGWQANTSYSIAFSAAQRGNWNQGGQDLKVLLDGNSLGTFKPNGSTYQTFQTFTTTAFTTSAGSHTLEFLGLNSSGGDNTALIDNIEVTTVQGLPITNNSFEVPVVGSGNFQLNPTGASWTFSGNTGISGNGSGYTSGNPNAPAGTQVAILQGNSNFSQSISGFQANTSYTVSFSAAQRGNWNQGGQDFQVLLDGTSLGTFKPSSSNYATFTTNTFTTTAGSHTLEFLGLDSAGGDNTALIDNVSIIPH